MAASGIALAVAALALKAADRRGRDGVTHRAAGAAPGKIHSPLSRDDADDGRS
jgi:hypothetical protein